MLCSRTGGLLMGTCPRSNEFHEHVIPVQRTRLLASSHCMQTSETSDVCHRDLFPSWEQSRGSRQGGAAVSDTQPNGTMDPGNGCRDDTVWGLCRHPTVCVPG